MEPVGRRWEDKLTRIVTASNHGCPDDVSHVTRLQHVTAFAINFKDFRFEVRRGIRLKQYSRFATIDIMMEVDCADIAIVCKHADLSIKFHSRPLPALCHVCDVSAEGSKR